MLRPLAALERFFERLFERPAAWLFRVRLQPVQLQRRLERAMEAERRFSADRTYVPNRYVIRLHPDDLAIFSSYQATLEADLAAALRERARGRGYSFVERPVVSLRSSDSVAPGEVEVEAELLDPLLLRPAPAGFQRVDAGGTEGGSGRGDHTAVFPVPQAQVGPVGLVVHAPGRPPERIVHRGGQLRIGRASDNDIVLVDDQVSRYHGQLAARQGTLVYVDLASTNGSFLNGAPVSEIALGPGDVLQIGRSTLTIDTGA